MQTSHSKRGQQHGATTTTTNSNNNINGIGGAISSVGTQQGASQTASPFFATPAHLHRHHFHHAPHFGFSPPHGPVFAQEHMLNSNGTSNSSLHALAPDNQQQQQQQQQQQLSQSPAAVQQPVQHHAFQYHSHHFLHQHSFSSFKEENTAMSSSGAVPLLSDPQYRPTATSHSSRHMLSHHHHVFKHHFHHHHHQYHQQQQQQQQMQSAAVAPSASASTPPLSYATVSDGLLTSNGTPPGDSACHPLLPRRSAGEGGVQAPPPLQQDLLTSATNNSDVARTMPHHYGGEQLNAIALHVGMLPHHQHHALHHHHHHHHGDLQYHQWLQQQAAQILQQQQSHVSPHRHLQQQNSTAPHSPSDAFAPPSGMSFAATASSSTLGTSPPVSPHSSSVLSSSAYAGNGGGTPTMQELYAAGAGRLAVGNSAKDASASNGARRGGGNNKAVVGTAPHIHPQSTATDTSKYKKDSASRTSLPYAPSEQSQVSAELSAPQSLAQPSAAASCVAPRPNMPTLNYGAFHPHTAAYPPQQQQYQEYAAPTPSSSPYLPSYAPPLMPQSQHHHHHHHHTIHSSSNHSQHYHYRHHHHQFRFSPQNYRQHYSNQSQQYAGVGHSHHNRQTTSYSDPAAGRPPTPTSGSHTIANLAVQPPLQPSQSSSATPKPSSVGGAVTSSTANMPVLHQGVTPGASGQPSADEGEAISASSLSYPNVVPATTSHYKQQPNYRNTTARAPPVSTVPESGTVAGTGTPPPHTGGGSPAVLEMHVQEVLYECHLAGANSSDSLYESAPRGISETFGPSLFGNIAAFVRSTTPLVQPIATVPLASASDTPGPATTDGGAPFPLHAVDSVEPVIPLAKVWEAFHQPYGLRIRLPLPVALCPFKALENNVYYEPQLSAMSIQFLGTNTLQHLQRATNPKQQPSGELSAGSTPTATEPSPPTAAVTTADDCSSTKDEEASVSTAQRCPEEIHESHGSELRRRSLSTFSFSGLPPAPVAAHASATPQGAGPVPSTFVWYAGERPENRRSVLEQVELLARLECPQLMHAATTDVGHQSWVSILWQPVFCQNHMPQRSCGSFLCFYALRPERQLFASAERRVSPSNVSTPSKKETAAAQAVPTGAGLDANDGRPQYIKDNLNWEQSPVFRIDNATTRYAYWSRTTPAPSTLTSTTTTPLAVLHDPSLPRAYIPLVGMMPNRPRADVWYLPVSVLTTNNPRHRHHSAMHGFHAPLFLQAAALQLSRVRQPPTPSLLRQGAASAVVPTNGVLAATPTERSPFKEGASGLSRASVNTSPMSYTSGGGDSSSHYYATYVTSRDGTAGGIGADAAAAAVASASLNMDVVTLLKHDRSLQEFLRAYA